MNNAQTYPKEIQEIHTAFFTAGDVLLKEAKEVLESTDQKVIAKAARLKAIGLPSASDVLRGEKLAEEIQLSKIVAEDVQYYLRKYPLYKFITVDIVERICQKYGLICAPSTSYTGFVPEKNLKEIENFKIDQADIDLGCIKILPATEENLSKAPNNFLDRLEAYTKLLLKTFPNEVVPYWCISHGWIVDYRNNMRVVKLSDIAYEDYKLPPLFICAPNKDMDLTKMNKVNKWLYGLLPTKHLAKPDPIVLKPVRGGYLIVTAWGDESNDEMIINPKHN